MDKEFVPYSLALRLKALGFDEPCFGWYADETHLSIRPQYIQPNDPNNVYNWCLAPTFSQAFRWFREKYGISIYVSPLEDGSAFYYMIYTNVNIPYSNRICTLPEKWETYEEAELACLDKLIEIVESKSE